MQEALRALRARCRALLDAAGVLEDPEEIARYCVDFWRNHRGRAALVLRPRSTAEVAAVVRTAAELGVAIVPQGGNTGLVAGGIPDESGRMAVVSLERMDRVRAVDPAGEWLICEAGCVLAEVQRKAAELGRLFPLSLGAEASCRIGGNIGTNAGGVQVLRWGMMRDLVLGLEVVLADGRVWNGLRPLRKDNTGYDLKQLFIGAEGTLGIVTAAALRLLPRPSERVTSWLAAADLRSCVALFRRFRDRFGDLLSSFEFMSAAGLELVLRTLEGVRPPVAVPAPWHLLVELAWPFDRGLRERLEAFLEDLLAAELVIDGTIAASEAARGELWRLREEQSEAARRAGRVLRFDVSVSPASIPELVATVEREARARMPEALPFPFGHLGDGNVHFNFLVSDDRIEQARRVIEPLLLDEVARLGGSFSAEHGIGRIKREELMRRRSAVELELMRRIKQALDPQGILNPGVILPEEER